jgi:hypothetical protein
MKPICLFSQTNTSSLWQFGGSINSQGSSVLGDSISWSVNGDACLNTLGVSALSPRKITEWISFEQPSPTDRNVLFEYFGFPSQFSFHQMFHPHLSSKAVK